MKYEAIEQYATLKGYRLYRGNARSGRAGKPTGFILWNKKGTWAFYKTLKEVEARIDSGR
jgi:hypothetical protein